MQKNNNKLLYLKPFISNQILSQTILWGRKKRLQQ